MRGDGRFWEECRGGGFDGVEWRMREHLDGLN